MNELTTIPFLTIDGDTTSLVDFGGKVTLIVNTASKCGFTPQYEGLQTLYTRYKDDGLVVIGFPANNFGKQEPGTNEEIQEFCSANFGVTFPMMAKVSVKGNDQHPLFRYLTTHADPAADISWNFHKYLIDKSGAIAVSFEPKTEPNDPALVAKIEELLEAD